MTVKHQHDCRDITMYSEKDFKFSYLSSADRLRYTLFGMFESTFKRLVNLQRVEDNAV